MAAQRGRRPAFTLVEATVALGICGLAAAAMLLAVESTVATTAEMRDDELARSIANAVIDEALGLKFAETDDPTAQWIGPDAGEYSRAARTPFDDLDDFNLHVSFGPLKDTFGVSLGEGDGKGGQRHPHLRLPDNYFQQWGMYVLVRPIDPSNPDRYLPSNSVSPHRSLDVYVGRVENGRFRVLVKQRRIVSHVPPMELAK
ncbi:MAG: hypothetical protein QGG36_06255 [Pirellulaceae bacterium]|jgi:type II secretory pathway pseudopilin PulG|nr:hypothetical protein [Pirellulaceae bacterium]MDP7015380.1 hypothetical protein [Pirellulaceae bacterium]